MGLNSVYYQNLFMRILIINDTKIPVEGYGGTERVIWYLGEELSKMGHEVTFLVREGSTCPFAKVQFLQPNLSLAQQIRNDYDVVHANYQEKSISSLGIPYVFTFHGNRNNLEPLDIQTIFVSENHANRFGSHAFVHNGLNWDDYGKPNWNQKKAYFHFLGKAAWRVKNVQGAIDAVLKTPTEQLKVLGGVRFNFKMGLRFTFSPRIQFYESVGGEEKNQFLQGSKGLIFPVKWHEPFGLAITESLYFGCPVFGTPYGSLKELVTPEVGFLSNSTKEISNALLHANDFNAKFCHDYAVEQFNSKKMAVKYLSFYEKAINGEKLNEFPPVCQKIQTEKFLPWS